MINFLKSESKEFPYESKKISSDYSIEQEQQIDNLILEDEAIFDYTLAKILFVAVTTTALFFLKHV